MDLTFVIPGTTTPEITVRRTMIGGVSLHVGGTQLKARGRWKPEYIVPLDDGTTKAVTLSGSYVGLKAKVDGVEIPLERPLSKVEQIAVLLPFALVAIGGALGAAIGVVAVAANATVMRSGMGLGARLGTAVMNLVLAVVAWYLLVGVIENLIN